MIDLKKITNSLFNKPIKKKYKFYEDQVSLINQLEQDYSSLKDEDLRKKTTEFKDRISNGSQLSDLLVEAGGIFFTELLNNNLVDEIHLFKSKIIIGKHGKPAIVGKKLSQLNLSLNERKKFKDDIYTNYQVN